MDNQRKALLVGSSFSAAPIFYALKNHNLYISVCGNIKSDPCHQYADASFYIDYSNPEDLLSVVDSEKFDYLVPTCNDYSYMSCALVAEKYGFAGFDRIEVATTLHIKDEFRRFAEKHSLPVPRFKTQKEAQPIDLGSLRFPLLVKPVDSFSGRGVQKIVDETDLPAAVRKAIRVSCSNEVVLEEFIIGSLHSHSAFIENKKVALDFFVDEFCTVYPYQVDCSNHPSIISDQIRLTVRETINQLAGILGLGNGLLHTQFIVNNDSFWIIECMRRCPGDLYGSLIDFSVCIDYAGLFVRPFLDMRLPTDMRKIPTKFISRHTISKKTPLVNFSFSHNIPATTVDIVSLKSSGEKLGTAPFDKLAILFAEYSDQQTLFDVTPRLADLIRVRTLGNMK